MSVDSYQGKVVPLFLGLRDFPTRFFSSNSLFSFLYFFGRIAGTRCLQVHLRGIAASFLYFVFLVVSSLYFKEVWERAKRALELLPYEGGKQQIQKTRDCAEAYAEFQSRTSFFLFFSIQLRHTFPRRTRPCESLRLHQIPRTIHNFALSLSRSLSKLGVSHLPRTLEKNNKKTKGTSRESVSSKQ